MQCWGQKISGLSSLRRGSFGSCMAQHSPIAVIRALSVNHAAATGGYWSFADCTRTGSLTL